MENQTTIQVMDEIESFIGRMFDSYDITPIEMLGQLEFAKITILKYTGAVIGNEIFHCDCDCDCGDNEDD